MAEELAEPVKEVRWTEGPDGEQIMPDGQRAYLEWLIDPERKGSQAQFARENRVTDNRLRVWKNDPRFKAELQKRCSELNIDDFRIQEVVNSLFKAATQDRDVRAATAYLQYVGRFMPTQRIISDRAIEEMSDAELEATLQAELGGLRLVAGGVREFDHEDTV